MFDLIGVRAPGDPEVFIAGVVTLFTHYPLRVMRDAIEPYKGIPGQRGRKQAWESEIEFYKKVLDELHAPILREEERLRAEAEKKRTAEAEKKRTAQLCLPRPPRTPEQQAKIDEQVEDARKRLGIPAGGFKRDKFIARPSDDAANPIAATAPADGKHALRVASDLAQRRPIP